MKRKFNGKRQAAKMVLGVAWYEPEQWERLLDISADRDELEATHAEWERNAVQSMKRLSRGGVWLEKVTVDLEELVQWCLSRNLPVDGKSRAAFASEKLRQGSEEHKLG